MQDNVLSEIIQLNIQGMNPGVQKQKINLKALSDIVTASSTKVPFVVLTETHLKDYILDAEVQIPSYNILRADRAKRRQGGVAIYFHHSYSVDDREVFSNQFCECAMSYNKQHNLVVLGVYRPPDTPTEKFTECLHTMKQFLHKYKDSTTLIFGDLNLKFIDWPTETIKKPINIKQTISSEERISSHMLLDFVSENLMVQMVTENTRKGKSILDLILTNDDDFIFDVTVEETNLDTDHDVVKCRIYNDLMSGDVHPPPQSEKRSIDELNFYQALK